MIDIKSYDNFGGVKIGSREDDVVAVFGEPEVRRVNREGERELHFNGFILRLDGSTNQLRECTLLPGCPSAVNGHTVTWDIDVLRWLASEDSELFEVLGYIVSLKLGIALTGFHDQDESQKAIHAFRRGDWDMFSKRMRRYAVADQA